MGDGRGAFGKNPGYGLSLRNESHLSAIERASHLLQQAKGPYAREHRRVSHLKKDLRSNEKRVDAFAPTRFG
jgi:hypothetical protein